MNEYEVALFGIISTLMLSILAMGADSNKMVEQLTFHESNLQSQGKLQGAATVGLLRNAIQKAQAS